MEVVSLRGARMLIMARQHLDKAETAIAVAVSTTAPVWLHNHVRVILLVGVYGDMHVSRARLRLRACAYYDA